MKRFLHCIHSLNPTGGGPADFVRSVHQLQQFFPFRMEIACLDSDNAEWLQPFGASVYALGPGVGGYGYAPPFVAWLQENRNRYDAIIIHGLWQFTSVAVRWAMQGSSIPYLVFPHGMLDPWFNQAYPAKAVKKKIYWHLAERFVLRDAAAVLFTSENERILARQSFRPYQAREMVVPYGTLAPDVNLGAARDKVLSKYPAMRGRRTFLFLGRVHPKKGCDLLVKTFQDVAAQHPETLLVIAGPGGAQLLEHSDSPAILRLEMVTGEEKWGLLAAADALILPSHQENFARSVTEALSCGTPVLLSNKVNIWETIVGSGAGFVADDSLAGTRKLFDQFLQLSAAGVGAMKENAQKCYAERFDLRRNFGGYLACLDDVCSHQF